MLKTPIKASQIANLTDARYFAAWQADWLGFCLDDTASNFLQAAEFVAIREWLEGPKFVGEFGLKGIEEILEMAKLMKLSAVQIGPFSSGEDLAALEGLEVFKEIIVEKHQSALEIQEQLKTSAPFVQHFLLDFSRNAWTWDDIRQSPQWGSEVLKHLCQDFPVFLDLNIAPHQLDQILKEINPEGLSLKGGEEEKVGIKSFDELDEILEALEK